MTRNASILGLKLRALRNTLVRGPKIAYALLALLGALLVCAEVYGTWRALNFLGGFGSIGVSVFQRVLETGLIVLTSGVTFTATTTAINTLYLSDDLNFLLTQPLPARRVFAVKVTETFLNAAAVPFALTIPILLTLGAWLHAPAWFYPLALLCALLVYALPVGLGAILAVVLMRVAPLGRVREVATALGVIISAALVYVIRAARPEQFLAQLQNPEQFERLLQQFASPTNPLLPPAWAAQVVWAGANGHASGALLPLAALAALLLGVATLLATHAYQAGWARGLESSRVRPGGPPRTASRLERLYARLGPGGTLAYKDLRTTLRDPTQWSQLLILVALAGVYLVSIRSVPLPPVPQFQNIVGYVQLAFQGFVIAGVGVRLAFPAVSQEGRGYWLLRTNALSARTVVLSKFLGVLPVTLLLALVLAVLSAGFLALSPVVMFASVLVAVSNALAMTALGVGLGAAAPRFTADNPSEIGLSPSGLAYMGLSLVYSVVLLLILARPTYLSISFPDQYPGLAYLATLPGALALALLLTVTVGVTWGALAYGWRNLDRHE
ncbi:putative ABC transporter permease subunit [Deinococcus maricopensis]|uniref:ABC-2 type transport system permease protein n=1 Tax=Deinococcus maricopensis (strain DSM 21211 / LMG 22137 / NRRL B-23946 / LB-34) TaxID=709986 RepID=E8U7N4_DEIML|nr:hypothetical protein [Deinococcus maricopensis]ADV67073.1 hypothetical protein Deima_1424 [Deinococcus maricopensis DSM 21211]